MLTVKEIQEEIDQMFTYSDYRLAEHWQSQLDMFAEDAFIIEPVTGCIELAYSLPSGFYDYE